VFFHQRLLPSACVGWSRHNDSGGGVMFSRGYATKEKAAAGAGAAAAKPKAAKSKPKAKPKAKAKGTSGSSGQVKPRKKKKVVKNKKIRVILTEDLGSTGAKGEDIEVAKGFARNFLFPKKLAIYCTEENLKLYEADRAKIDYEKRKKMKELLKAKKRLSKVEVLMKRHLVSPKVLHAPVSAENIVEKLKRQHKIELSADQLDLSAPITQLGTFNVPVKIEQAFVDLKVRVQAR